MISAVGHSANPIMSQAMDEIISQCDVSLGGQQPDLGFLFTSRMDQNFIPLLQGIMKKWPEVQLVGCTTDGEISDISPCIEDSVCLMLIKSERITFSVGIGYDLSVNPEKAVRSAAADIGPAKDGDFALGIVLAEGIKTFGVSIDNALRKVFGEKLPFIGGLSGDHMLFDKTILFSNDRIIEDSIIVVLASGKVDFSMTVGCGINPLGSKYPVDRSKDNIVWTIDGKPAVDFLKQHLGCNKDIVPQYPLAVYYSNDDFFVLRDPIEMCQEDGSVKFVGTFPENAWVRITEFDRQSLIQSSRFAIQRALESYPGTRPDLALVFPCTSRRHFIGTNAAEEHAPLLQFRKNNPGMRLCGMYAYGEIAPIEGSGMVKFHNDTYPVLLLGDG